MSKKAHDFLMTKSKEENEDLHTIISLNGQVEIAKGGIDNAFEFLFQTCVGQQLSSKASESIWGRVVGLCQNLDLTLLELADQKYCTDLRSCGISNNKLKAAFKLRDRFIDQPSLSAQIFGASYENVTDLVTSNWGFGAWSADMCAIFFCGQKDVMPTTDVAINNSLLKLHVDTKEIYLYAPYRSYLCLHLWKATDERRL